MTAVVVIEGVVIALLLLLVAGLLRSHAEILRKLDRIESRGHETEGRSQNERLKTTGFGTAPMSDISGVDPKGSATTVGLRHGKGETLVAFLSTGCASCRTFWTELGPEAHMPTPTTRAIIVTKGPQSESPPKVAELAPIGVRIVMSDEAWDSFRVPLTPYFMLVSGSGEILGEGSATDLDHLNSLLEQSAADANPTRLGTKDREQFTDDRLTRSGVEPGDPSLYEDPLG